MSDNGLWFKLWCASLDDVDLDNLDIADFGRWAKLGAYIKQHGQAGEVRITAPARTLCTMFQVIDFASFQAAVSRLPNVRMRREKSIVSNETITIVSFSNWLKYQGDYSTSRVRKFREMKRSRGEERRGEEIRKEENTSLASSHVEEAKESSPIEEPTPVKKRISHDYSENFETWWEMYPHTNGAKKNAWDMWEKQRKAGKLLTLAEMCSGIYYETSQNEKWKNGYIPYAERWLKSERYVEAASLAAEMLATNAAAPEHRNGSPASLLYPESDPNDPLLQDPEEP